jgi:hypothetical protein
MLTCLVTRRSFWNDVGTVKTRRVNQLIARSVQLIGNSEFWIDSSQQRYVDKSLVNCSVCLSDCVGGMRNTGLTKNYYFFVRYQGGPEIHFRNEKLG